MTIKKQVKAAAAPAVAVDAFISGAPDAQATTREKTAGVVRGKKLIVTVGFTPELLHKIDEAAAASGISRAAFISLACSNAIQK